MSDARKIQPPRECPARLHPWTDQHGSPSVVVRLQRVEVEPLAVDLANGQPVRLQVAQVGRLLEWVRLLLLALGRLQVDTVESEVLQRLLEHLEAEVARLVDVRAVLREERQVGRRLGSVLEH